VTVLTVSGIPARL